MSDQDSGLEDWTRVRLPGLGPTQIRFFARKSMQVTEKEKAEWAALGKRRENADKMPRETAPRREKEDTTWQE